MFRRIETIEEAIAEGKNARGLGVLLIFATLSEASYRLVANRLTTFMAIDFAILLLILTFLLWRVWHGRAVASAIALLVAAIGCLWIGITAPAWLMGFCALWGFWDGVRGLRGGLAYRRIVRSAQTPDEAAEQRETP